MLMPKSGRIEVNAYPADKDGPARLLICVNSADVSIMLGRFFPDQARELASLLLKQADAAEGVIATPDYGSEHEPGLDGLFCCCDSRTETPPAGFGQRYVKTHHPATSPAMGTPAFAAWAAGAEVWEPVLILRGAA